MLAYKYKSFARRAFAPDGDDDDDDDDDKDD